MSDNQFVACVLRAPMVEADNKLKFVGQVPPGALNCKPV
jgi:hypothetical protein